MPRDGAGGTQVNIGSDVTSAGFQQLHLFRFSQLDIFVIHDQAASLPSDSFLNRLQEIPS